MMYVFTKCVEYNGEEKNEKGLTNLFVRSEMWQIKQVQGRQLLPLGFLAEKK